MSKKPFELVNNNVRISLILALLYCLLFNSSVLIFKFDYYKANMLRGVLELLKDSLYIYITSFIIFFGLSVSRILLAAGALFLFTTGAIGSYSLHFFKVAPTKQMLRAMFESESHEMGEVISLKLVIWVMISAAICITVLWRLRRRGDGMNLASFTCLLVFCANIVLPHYKILTQYFPMQYLHNSYLYFSERSRPAHKVDISSKFIFIDRSDDDIIGILVIGESARYDHFGINGYKRSTTPLISKIPNLFSFKAQACANITYNSVPCMLTHVTKEKVDKALEETTFLSVLTKLGFNTSWVGTQSLLKYLKTTDSETIYDEAGLAIIPGGSALYQMNDHDEVMLPYLDNIMAKPGKKFIVLHTSGSHWNYLARYPKEYNTFTPVCPSSSKIDQSSCTMEQLVNSYDNSILYTDYILDQIIKRLAGKNAFLIYASDHGESLGENGVYAHGSHITPEQLTIPFVFWGSDSFIKRHPKLLKSLAKRKRVELSHDYIFHSALDCSGVEGEIIDKGLSLCK